MQTVLTVDAPRTVTGRAFEARAAANGNARSPTVERCVDGTSSVDVSAEHRRRRASMLATLCRLSDR